MYPKEISRRSIMDITDMMRTMRLDMIRNGNRGLSQGRKVTSRIGLKNVLSIMRNGESMSLEEGIHRLNRYQRSMETTFTS